MHLEIIILGKVRKRKYHMLSLIHGIKKKLYKLTTDKTEIDSLT